LQLTEHNFIIRFLDSISVIVSIHAIISSR
jgi:hypothetical protein